MKVVTVGTFDNSSDLNILKQIYYSKQLNCERLIIYLFTDRITKSNLNYENRKSNLQSYLNELEIKSYINPLDTKSLYFLCQYDKKHYKIVLREFYNFEIEPTNLIYGGDLPALQTP